LSLATAAALRSFIRPELVRADSACSDADELLSEVAELLARGQAGARGAEILAGLRERERLGTTAIGNGCAIPHARLARLAAPVLVVIRSVRGIDFGAPDGGAVRLFFGLGTPASSPGAHLQVLSAIARWVRVEEHRSALLAAPDAAAMAAVLESA
jgi:mannitol/fructose-specific phosphotransferase system IIA component (Ntr-type)